MGIYKTKFLEREMTIFDKENRQFIKILDLARILNYSNKKIHDLYINNKEELKTHIINIPITKAIKTKCKCGTILKKEIETDNFFCISLEGIRLLLIKILFETRGKRFDEISFMMGWIGQIRRYFIMREHILKNEGLL